MDTSSIINMMQSAADEQSQLVEGYTEIMRKMSREAMDEIKNLVEKHSSTTAGSGGTSSPDIGSKAEDSKKPVLRKGGYSETLEEVLKEVEKNRKERKSFIPDKPSSSSSQNKNGLKVGGGKLSVLGMGGVGETVIHNSGSTNNFSYGTVQLTNHYYYGKKTNEQDDDADF